MFVCYSLHTLPHALLCNRPAIHPSHKELAAACGRGTRPPWELRGPHPSVQYPNLCLQPRKAASGQSSNGQTFRCTQWRTMADGESSETAKTDLQPLSDLPPVRTVSNRQVTSGSQLELTCSSIVIEGDGKLGGRPLTHLSRCSCRLDTTPISTCVCQLIILSSCADSVPHVGVKNKARAYRFCLIILTVYSQKCSFVSRSTCKWSIRVP